MTSSDERKCIKCDFSAPVSDWKVWPQGHRHNVLCYECRYMMCKVCKFFDGRVWQWRYEEDGVSGFRCPKCTHPDLRKCGREFCSFWAPLKDWKIKAGGVPGKWCERCCDIAAKKSVRVKERKQTDDDYEKPPPRIFTEAQRENARVRNTVMVTCPDCKKEMQSRSLKVHSKYRSCKGKPAE
jgi:hypothetical protein